MTKKDFIIIAEVLRKHRPIHTEDGKITARWYLFADIVDEFCRVLKNDNEKFNAQKFWQAVENATAKKCKKHSFVFVDSVSGGYWLCVNCDDRQYIKEEVRYCSKCKSLMTDAGDTFICDNESCGWNSDK